MWSVSICQSREECGTSRIRGLRPHGRESFRHHLYSGKHGHKECMVSVGFLLVIPTVLLVTPVVLVGINDITPKHNVAPSSISFFTPIGKIRQRWQDIINIAIEHKLGTCPVGEASVVIVISSGHRKDSLEAVHFAIDEIKAVCPIWKKVCTIARIISLLRHVRNCCLYQPKLTGMARVLIKSLCISFQNRSTTLHQTQKQVKEE